ncbi:MAG: hypothetical protein GX444_21490 [Myxococcales bacterium]|nr:hypothetical protein [Myxococcales bacterium]
MAATELTNVGANIYGLGSTSDATNLYESQQTDLTDPEVFINLLIEEMKNQDPLDPMSNQEYVAQLAQLSLVEQTRTINTNLETLQLFQSSINNAQSVSMIGKEVKASGDSFYFDGDGTATLKYQLDEDAATVTIKVYKSDGTLQRTLQLGSQESGEQTAEWDGANNDGSPLDAGNYTFAVTATDAEGNAVTASTYLTGRVTGIVFKDGVPYMQIGSQEVTMGDILEIFEGN